MTFFLCRATAVAEFEMVSFVMRRVLIEGCLTVGKVKHAAIDQASGEHFFLHKTVAIVSAAINDHATYYGKTVLQAIKGNS